MAAKYSMAVTSGTATGTSIDVPSEGLVIGRSGRLAADEAISRRHARVFPTSGGQLIVEDLESLNGTYVNNVRINTPELLHHGDEVRVGGTVLRVGGTSEDTQVHGGARVGRDVRADRGSVGAVGAIHGSVDLSHRTVRADRGGYAAGRDLYQSHRHEYDASGLEFITSTTGIARFFVLMGILLGIAGLGLAGYPIVREVSEGTTNASSPAEMTQARRACDDKFPLSSPEHFRCVEDAMNAQYDKDTKAFAPELTPWLPLGIATFFAGMLMYLVGIFLRRAPEP